jgi:hypothetical protein
VVVKDHILLFNTLNWATFPCLSEGEKAKSPACTDWKSRQPDPLNCLAELPAYEKAGAYGVILRSDDLIIDIDPWHPSALSGDYI